jgi:hypothetical protein
MYSLTGRLLGASGQCVEAPHLTLMALFRGGTYISCLAGSCSPSWPFILSVHSSKHSQHSLTHLAWLDHHLVRSENIQVHCFWVVASRGTWWLCFATDFTCYSWWLLPPRRLSAVRIVERRKVIVSNSDRGDCEGFLTFPQWRAKRYYSGLLVAYGSLSCVGCAAPDYGLGVWCLLAREPLSEWITTTETSLPASKWTSMKNHCVILCKVLDG